MDKTPSIFGCAERYRKEGEIKDEFYITEFFS